MAEQEYEAGFLAAAPSVVVPKGLADGVSSPDYPDQIQDAKGWLIAHMPADEKYRPTADPSSHANVGGEEG